MRTQREHLADEKASREEDRSSTRLDVMLIDPDEQRALSLMRELEAVSTVRIACRSSGREALAAFARARFDAIICRQDLQDTDCWRWIRMVRSGRFGFAATPVIILCTPLEQAELGPVLDPYTSLTIEGDPSLLDCDLRDACQGAARTRVLVVEDEAFAAQAAQRALGKYYCVDIAGDGEEALELWQARRHELIILDLMLPGLSGAEVLNRILRVSPHQLIIVLTAHDAPEKHQELMLAGAYEFLSKPADLHMLPELCSRVLRAHECLSNVRRSLRQESRLADVLGRVRAANYYLERGQAAYAGAHLRRAILEGRAHFPSDDHWAHLLSEFDRE
jgi:DNA-binding response OmpR family regulator